ncbi:MAG TPA: class F sortase [Arthrobacter sp.]|nr:class F sortase [Arthrobacter sp.]
MVRNNSRQSVKFGALVAAAVVLSGCAEPAPPSSADAAATVAKATDAAKPETPQPQQATLSGSQTRPAAPAPTDIPVQPAGVRPGEKLPRPTSLSIAGTDIDVEIVRVGMAENNAMQIPEDFHRAGWYKYGPAPGADEGHAVIAGHVDSLTEVMPFAQLEEVKPGTVVTVGRQDAEPVRYQVTDVRHIPKATLEGTGIFARDGPHRLKIITCGGDWLPEKEDYADNIVLTAAPL